MNTAAQDLFPPAPAGVSDELTQPTRTYKIRVALTLVSIVVFLAIYFGLIAACAYLAWWSLASDAANWITAVIGILLLAFLLKVLFKRQRTDRSGFVEVTETEQPRLFAFLRKLVDETGAPFPKHVYLSHDVNAAVFYDSSFLSLFFPVRKNLVIGLGLVNALNLTELKAVLAHEFGHFSQRSMKLGSYVYVANHVLGDMIWSRDGWDRAVAWINRTDLRIAWIGWIVTAITWVLRQALGLLFRIINVVHAALSRQMEFAADRFAVRATGSDGLIHALKKVGFADVCMEQTFSDLSDAMDHDLYSDDIYHHQTTAAAYLRRRDNRPDWGVPPQLPDDRRETVQVFDPDSDTHPSMWSSHPRDAEREANAKASYIRSDFDERSAWELFVDAEEVRRTVTEQFLRRVVERRAELSPAEDVQRFIDEERSETLHDPRYGGVYQGRMLGVDGTDAVFAAARGGAMPSPDLAAAYTALYDEAFAQRAAKYRSLLEEKNALLRTLSSGEKIRSLSFRGEKHDPERIPELLEILGKELSDSDAWLDEHDREVAEVYAAMAHGLDDASWLDELEQRYRFQRTVQQALGALRGIREDIEPELEFLATNNELDEHDVSRITQAFNDARDNLVEAMNATRGVRTPALANMDETELHDFLVRDPIPDLMYHSDQLTPDWINRFLDQCAQIHDRLARLAVKGVGGILSHQQAIAALWQAKNTIAVATA